MNTKDWIQLAFGLSNGLSFALTFRHAAWAKIAGSCVLLVAHPGVAAYFLATGQPFFLVGNAIMTAAGLYGLVRGLRALRRERRVAAEAQAIREGWEAGLAKVVDRAIVGPWLPDDLALRTLDRYPPEG